MLGKLSVILKIIVIVYFIVCIAHVIIEIFSKSNITKHILFDVRFDKKLGCSLVGFALVLFGDYTKGLAFASFEFWEDVLLAFWLLYLLFGITVIKKEYIVSCYGKRLYNDNVEFGIDDAERIIYIFYMYEKCMLLKVSNKKFDIMISFFKSNYKHRGDS